MKILLASNSFKECATAQEVNDAIEQGILLFESLFVPSNRAIEISKEEICDGGTGFASILTKAAGGSILTAKARDPLMREIIASYGISPDKETAFIEVAQTCGLAKLSEDEKNPINTTSYGVGTQFIDAIDRFRPKKILLGCGDTAINDFGLGFLYALGARFLDINNQEIQFLRPTDFLKVVKIDLSSSQYIDYLSKHCTVQACCNLSSIIGGEESNTKVYAKQKGASDVEIEQLMEVRDRLLSLIEEQIGHNVALIPGTGAAGGLGTAIYAFCRGKLSYSFEIILPTIGIEKKLSWADLVITGEGLVDNSSLKGKAPISLALAAKRYGKEVALIAGAIRTNCTNIIIRGGVDYVETLTDDSFALHKYISNAKVLLRDAGFRLMKKVYR